MKKKKKENLSFRFLKKASIRVRKALKHAGSLLTETANGDKHSFVMVREGWNKREVSFPICTLCYTNHNVFIMSMLELLRKQNTLIWNLEGLFPPYHLAEASFKDKTNWNWGYGTYTKCISIDLFRLDLVNSYLVPISNCRLTGYSSCVVWKFSAVQTEGSNWEQCYCFKKSFFIYLKPWHRRIKGIRITHMASYIQN